MSTNYPNHQIKIFAWSIFLGIVQAMRKLRDIPLNRFHEIIKRTQLMAIARIFVLSAFGLLLGFSAGLLIVWLIFESSRLLR
jgi:hypothetical protein